MPSSDHDQLSRHLLRELASLNYRFILLLNEFDPAPDQLGLSPPLHERLRLLDESDRRRLASCPYGLFDLRLDQPVQWQAWFDQTPSPQPETSASTFTLAALLYSQQLAVENIDLGRLLLGLSPRVAEHFRRASIGQLMDIAPLVSQHLNVRLIDDPNFWPDLVNFVRDGTDEQYVAAQTSAIQIMAAQL
ncbi:MAG: hypothetical protein AAF465_10290 [Pseudomonadota bacterium]